MQLKIKRKESVVWPVTVNIPADGGALEEHNFFARFKRLPEKEFDAAAKEGQTPLLKGLLLEVGETESSLEKLSDEDKAELLSGTNYRVGLYNAYLKMDAGVAEKNS
jgi:hypothetical protein